MSSQRQTAANRRNATLSTGPRTPQGKRVSARNALKHGLLSRQHLTPGESLRHFMQLRRELHAALAPQNALESLLVDRIVDGVWRLRRLGRAESEVFAIQSDDCRSRQTGRAVVRDAGQFSAFATLCRYQTALDRFLFRALHELEKLQGARFCRMGEQAAILGELLPEAAASGQVNGAAKSAQRPPHQADATI